jgi:hypothetical protein
LGGEFGLALLQGVPDGPEQHHVEEKDQEQKIDNQRVQSPINVNHPWLPPRNLFT